MTWPTPIAGKSEQKPSLSNSTVTSVQQQYILITLSKGGKYGDYD